MSFYAAWAAGGRSRLSENMVDESMLRARARAAMTAGHLPDHRPEHMWGGPGSGESCAVCGNAVDKDDVELELQFTSGHSSGTANYHVHGRCFAAWELERRSRSSNGQSLSESGNGTIMPDRERNEANTRERG